MTTRAAFLDLLEKSNLLTAEGVEQARAAESPDAAEIAAALVKEGSLTRWQAKQLLAGQYAFFLGKYKLLERISGGGMGSIYRAEQYPMGRTVALKVISERVLRKERVLKRFRREIRVAASLNHPNIVKVLDADQVGQTQIMVMEFIVGKDLRQWLKEYGRLPIDWSCECIRQAARGLQHIDEAGLVHRDIKPSNLLIPEEDEAAPQVKILDLGLARFTSEHQQSTVTISNEVLGTIDYISPEQTEASSEVDIRTDIYSLGATLFRMLTGEVLFAGRNALQRLSARRKNDAPAPSQFRDEIPTELDVVVGRMLARNREDRYQHAWEVAEALAPFALPSQEEPQPSKRG